MPTSEEKAREDVLEEVREAEATLANNLEPFAADVREAMAARLAELEAKAIVLELPTTKIEQLRAQINQGTPEPQRSAPMQPEPQSPAAHDLLIRLLEQAAANEESLDEHFTRLRVLLEEDGGVVLPLEAGPAQELPGGEEPPQPEQAPAPPPQMVQENGVIFTRDEAPNAQIANGERIIKVNSEDEDAHPNGSEGVVVGSLDMREAPQLQALPPEQQHVEVAYFIAWDDAPSLPVGTLDYKVVAA
jgi:hypothetical protein